MIFFIFAGHDTTSSCLCRCLFELTKHPEYRDQLREEVRQVLFGGGEIDTFLLEDKINPKTLEDMTFLKRIVKEALRINPPTSRSIGYSAVEDFTTSDGLFIPKDTMLEFNITAAHWDPKQWQQPDEFRPERFDPDHPMFKTPSGENRHSHTYVPFGFGMRSCAGQALAHMELKVFIIAFVTGLDWTGD